MQSVTHWLNENSDKILVYGMQVVIALIILLVGIQVAKGSGKLITKMIEQKNADKAVGSFLASIVYALVIAATVIMALTQLGVATTSFLTILGAAGLAIGLALKDSLANFASGVMLLLLRPFKAGDFIEAAGQSGSVTKVEVFSTELLTPDNKTIVVPNSAVTSGAITNYTRQPMRRVDITIGVSYDACLKETKNILEQVIISNDKILKDPTFFVGVTSLGDSSVNIVTRSWTKTEDYWEVYFYLQEHFKLALDDAGIAIPYPQMDVYLNKVND
jgi:small conductance mechanosensitive channel